MTAPAGRTALFPIGPTAPRSYAPGSPERTTTAAALADVRTADYDIANLIGGAEIRTGRQVPVVIPHQHKHHLGQVHWAGATETLHAIEAATGASAWWGRLPWEERAAPFLRAADLLQYGPWRTRLNAATMLNSRRPYQAEIDAACETVDFIRANVANMREMYEMQPDSLPRHVEPGRVPAARGVRLRGHPVQLHLHRNNLAFAPAHAGQHRRVEAG